MIEILKNENSIKIIAQKALLVNIRICDIPNTIYDEFAIGIMSDARPRDNQSITVTIPDDKESRNFIKKPATAYSTPVARFVFAIISQVLLYRLSR